MGFIENQSNKPACGGARLAGNTPVPAEAAFSFRWVKRSSWIGNASGISDSPGIGDCSRIMWSQWPGVDDGDGIINGLYVKQQSSGNPRSYQSCGLLVRAIAFELLYNQHHSKVLRIKGGFEALGLDSEPSGFVLLQNIQCDVAGVLPSIKDCTQSKP